MCVIFHSHSFFWLCNSTIEVIRPQYSIYYRSVDQLWLEKCAKNFSPSITVTLNRSVEVQKMWRKLFIIYIHPTKGIWPRPSTSQASVSQVKLWTPDSSIIYNYSHACLTVLAPSHLVTLKTRSVIPRNVYGAHHASDINQCWCKQQKRHQKHLIVIIIIIIIIIIISLRIQ